MIYKIRKLRWHKSPFDGHWFASTPVAMMRVYEQHKRWVVEYESWGEIGACDARSVQHGKAKAFKWYKKKLTGVLEKVNEN